MAPLTPGSSRFRAAGFSLLELLFTLLIAATALLLASRLLLESQSRMSHAARQAADPVGEIARRQIRADLRACGGVRTGLTATLWSRAALELRGHPAGAVRYEKAGSELIRVVAAGSEPARRTVLLGVTTFRWRVKSGRLGRSSVEIDLGFRVTPRFGPLAVGGVREAPIPEEDRRVFRVTPRGVGGQSW